MPDHACISCGGSLEPFATDVFDTRFGVPGRFEEGRCRSCGLVQLAPVPPPAELKRLYETWYNFGGSKGGIYGRLRATLFESALYRLWMTLDGDISFHGRKGRGRLLDLGCNEGRGLLLYRRNGFEVEGLELNEVAAAEARQKGFTVTSTLLSEFRPERPFEVVVLSNVLEHAVNPREMLADVARVLSPGGEVWVSAPNIASLQRRIFGTRWVNWHPPFHVSHFSPETLRGIFGATGFRTVEIRQESPALWAAQSLIGALFARPGEPTRALRNPALVAGLLLLIRCALFPALAAANRLGWGDCLVARARKA